jgi:hypothetical protein
LIAFNDKSAEFFLDVKIFSDSGGFQLKTQPGGFVRMDTPFGRVQQFQG